MTEPLPLLDRNTPPPRRPGRPSVTWVSIAVGLLIAIGGLIVLSAVTQGVALMFMGVTQAVYMVPAYIVARSRERQDIARVIVILAGITFLVNAACFGFVFVSF